jgi:hypothetical protein
MTTRLTRATAILVALLVAAGILVVVELGMGAIDTGPTVANPCKPRAPFPGSGIDAAIQRIVLNGLDGAACRLDTTREELVLSLRSGEGRRVHFDKQKIEAAVRAGLLRAVDDAERRGDIPGFVAPLARRLIRTVPIDKLVEGGIRLSDLIP